MRDLEELITQRGVPKMIVTDNGPKFAGKALDAWAYRGGVKLHFIRPGKPAENAYVESFNGKFRDDGLNEHWFTSLAHARDVIEGWRKDYNDVRPHSSLGNDTAAEFARRARAELRSPTPPFALPENHASRRELSE